VKLKITRWEYGFEKIRFNHLLRERLGMSLAEAQSVVDAILEIKPDEPVEVDIPDGVDAAARANLLVQSRALGVVCYFNE
jgi:hypothetical protein